MGSTTVRALALTLLAAELPVRADDRPCDFLVQPDSVITANVAKVAARSMVGADTVARALLYAHYSRTSSNKMAGARVDTLLADDSVPPFEALWDCSAVRNQDNYNLWFSATLFDKRGRQLGDSCSDRRAVALDRDTTVSSKICTVSRTGRAVVVDGDLREWSGCGWEHFGNGDNSVSFAAQWDRQRLYFAVRVQDSTVFAAAEQPSGPSSPGLPVYLQDGVEVFLDWAHDRSPVRRADDYQAMIAADGRLRINAAGGGHSDVAAARDSAGYRIEIAFPWDLCPSGPRPGMRIGFNLVNSDREALGGVVATASWAGISDLVHHNPTQWGTLVLAGRRPWWPWAAAAAVVCLALFVAVSRRRCRVVVPPPSPAELWPVLRDVLAFLEANYANEQLDSAAVAKSVNLSGPYLGRLIKRETRRNFREFLNRFRVEKAKPLLSGTNLTVSEIAYKVGYTTPSLFSQAFQRYAGMSPSQYRRDAKG